MIVFESMLLSAATTAGMKTPPIEQCDNDTHPFTREEYPHFTVFCAVQLARPVSYHGEHWENAKVIAAVPEVEICSIDLPTLIEKGLIVG